MSAARQLAERTRAGGPVEPGGAGLRFRWEDSIGSYLIATRRRRQDADGLFHVAVALARFGNADGTSVRPSQARLARRLSMNPDSVGRSLRMLEGEGWIVCVDRSRGRGQVNEYTLVIPKGWEYHDRLDESPTPSPESPTPSSRRPTPSREKPDTLGVGVPGQYQPSSYQPLNHQPTPAPTADPWEMVEATPHEATGPEIVPFVPADLDEPDGSGDEDEPECFEFDEELVRASSVELRRGRFSRATGEQPGRLRRRGPA